MTIDDKAVYFHSLPQDVVHRISCYLEPAELFILCQYDPENSIYQTVLVRSLNRNIRTIMQRGFDVDGVDPFESFVRMTEKLPPGSVCISGSAAVEALNAGSSKNPSHASNLIHLLRWGGADIDIFCTSDAAPLVRTWLTEWSKIDQVYCGITELYPPFLPYPSSDDEAEYDDIPVSHVENYVKRALGESGGERKRGHCFPSSGSEVCLLTSNGEGVPIRSHVPPQHAKKKNIDLVVLKRGRTVYEALATFDIKICKTSFDGALWTVPDPFLSFMGCTVLTSLIDNQITCQYITSIMKQAGRKLHEVAREMRLPLSRQIGYGRALQAVSTNVFHPLALRPTTCAKRIALVYVMRAHLISNAIKQVEQTNDRFARRLPPVEPVDLHNHIMRHSFKRYEKYKLRDIKIVGMEKFCDYMKSTIVVQLPHIVQELTDTNLVKCKDREIQEGVVNILPNLEEVHGSNSRVYPGTFLGDIQTEIRQMITMYKVNLWGGSLTM